MKYDSHNHPKNWCAGAVLIRKNIASNGELLRSLEAIKNPTCDELSAKHILQNQNAWKPEEYEMSAEQQKEYDSYIN